MITISHPTKVINANINLPASKSISNRLLVIHFLMNKSFKIENLSNCNDTVDLINALHQIESKNNLTLKFCKNDELNDKYFK
jgi:3-phosphoshikimate 1-carboxyvinyltransferase